MLTLSKFSLKKLGGTGSLKSWSYAKTYCRGCEGLGVGLTCGERGSGRPDGRPSAGQIPHVAGGGVPAVSSLLQEAAVLPRLQRESVRYSELNAERALCFIYLFRVTGNQVERGRD